MYATVTCINVTVTTADVDWSDAGARPGTSSRSGNAAGRGSTLPEFRVRPPALCRDDQHMLHQRVSDNTTSGRATYLGMKCVYISLNQCDIMHWFRPGVALYRAVKILTCLDVKLNPIACIRSLLSVNGIRLLTIICLPFYVIRV